MNTSTSVSAPNPLVATAPAPALALTSIIRASSIMLKVYHLVVVIATLLMEEPTSPSTSTNRAQDKEQQSPKGETSLKHTCVAKDDAFGEMTPFIKIFNTLSSRIPHTPKEATVIVSTSDSSFVQNLPEWDKMEMAIKLSHNMFKVEYNFSLIYVGRGDFLDLGSPFKERDT